MFLCSSSHPAGGLSRTVAYVLSIAKAAVCLVCLSAVAITALPPVILVENHSDVFPFWVQTGIRGAAVVNVDAHYDCYPISQRRADKLRLLVEAGDIAGIDRANSGLDSGLYGIENFITAAYNSGIAREEVWVAPPLEALNKKWTHLPFSTCPLESLPKIKGPVLLTVDADFVLPYASARCISELEAVRRIAKILRTVPWNVVHASVCFSVDGNYLPETMRWIGNALEQALNGKDVFRPDTPWTLLSKVEKLRLGLPPNIFVEHIQPFVRKHPKNPWLHVYCADALFRIGDVSGALAAGRKAAHYDPGCSRILPEIGRQLATANRLDTAEIFLAAAPNVVNVAAELTLAQALDKAGRTTDAIGHYSRIRNHVSLYCTDLLLGYAYERLGDSTKALQHYLATLALLNSDIGEMPSFPNVDSAILSAEHFLRSTGNVKQADAFRRDPRIAPSFNDAK